MKMMRREVWDSWTYFPNLPVPKRTKAVKLKIATTGNIESMTVPQLKALCKLSAMRGYSRLKRADLIARLTHRYRNIAS